MFGMKMKVMRAETNAKPDPIQKTPCLLADNLAQEMSRGTHCITTISAGATQTLDNIWESVSPDKCADYKSAFRLVPSRLRTHLFQQQQRYRTTDLA